MKKSLVALALTLGILSSGCLGPNRTFTRMNEWNQGVFENRWANEALFIVLVPIHGLAWCADLLVFNTMDWWKK